MSHQTGNLVNQIDARLDSIARLREAGLLGPEEFEPVFHSLKIALDSYLLLETVNMNAGYSGHLWGVSWPLEYDLITAKLDSAETAIMDLDDTPQAYPDSMRQAMLDEIQHLKQELETTRNMLPAVHDLLIDLELF